MATEDVREIGERVEPFVDEWLIARLDGTELRLKHPVRQEVVMVFDRPWEGNTSGYPVIFEDEGRFRLYYRGSHTAGGTAKADYEPEQEMLCFAESRDGIQWDRPDLGLVEYLGSTANNIIMPTAEGGDTFSVIRDESPNATPADRYKAGTGIMDYGFFALVSSDGLRWRRTDPDPLLADDRGYDWTQTLLWDGARGRYAAYLRGWQRVGGGEVSNLKLTPPRKRIRHVRVTTSTDFITWTTPKLIDLDVPLSHEEQFYTSAIQPHPRAPHILVGTPKRYMPRRQANFEQPEPGLSDVAFIASRDGHRFKRWPEAFLRPGRDIKNWVQRNNSPAIGMLQLADDEISLYWIEHYHQEEPSRLRRGTVRVDGFAAVHAGADGGAMVTRPLTFTGTRLVINYATSAFGAVQVEIQDEAGKAIEGFRMDQCPIIYGDEIAHAVGWTDGANVSRLAGTPVRLRFSLRDADLYSIRFDHDTLSEEIRI